MGGGKGRGTTTQAITRNPFIQPDRYFAKLRTVSFSQIGSGAAGIYAANTLRLNDCNDPLGSLGSGSPVGFSDWCSNASSSYRFYRVHSAKVVLSVLADTTTVGLACLAMSPRNASTAAPTSMSQIGGQARSVSTQFATAATTGFPHKLSMYCKMPEIYGVSPQTYAAADAFASIYNAAPTNVVLMDIGTADALLTTAVTMSVKIDIIQWVEFYGRNTAS